MSNNLTLYEAATLVSLSPASLHHLTAGGIIPSRFAAGQRTIAREDLVRWATVWGNKLVRVSEREITG